MFVNTGSGVFHTVFFRAVVPSTDRTEVRVEIHCVHGAPVLLWGLPVSAAFSSGAPSAEREFEGF